MLTLIRNAEVFAPEPLGRRDVLLAGGTIAAVEPSIDLAGEALLEVDATGEWLLPGLVDALTHPAGGGGEGGFIHRTPEISASEFVRAGITTPVGALGTDAITRNLETLYGHIMHLRSLGLSARMYSGSYWLPAVTLCGSVTRDLLLVEPLIGVGEVAIADHRSSQPSATGLRRLAAETHLGGTLSGKGGTVLLHVGDGESGLALVEQVLAESELPRRLFYPTHINRRPELLQQALQHVRAGGYADITVSTTDELLAAGEVSALEAFRQLLDAGAEPERISFSSDAGGSLPYFAQDRLESSRPASPSVLLELLGDAAEDPQLFPHVLASMSRNPAEALCLSSKGRIAVGCDADLLFYKPREKQLTGVICAGRRLL